MAKVSFKRIENSADINNVSIVDGQIIYTKDGKTYLDYEGQRVVINGTPDTTISETSTNAIANSTIKNYVDTKIAEVNSNIHNGFILWQNTNTSEAWSSARTITLNSDDYDMIEFIYSYGSSASVLGVKTTGKIPKEKNTQLDFVYNPSTSDTHGTIRRREVTYVNDTQYTIGANIGADGDYACRPIYVIGYKTGLFS